MIRSLGLNHINLNVRDLERSLRFYERAFGLELKFREGEAMAFIGAPGGRDLITLCQAEDGAPIAGGGVSHFGFAFDRVQPMDAIVTQIEKAGGSLKRRGEHAPGEPFAYFDDPDGYVIEIGYA